MVFPALVLLAGQGAPLPLVRHHNPAGFTLEHPRGWIVETPGNRRVQVRAPDGSSFVLIQGMAAAGQDAPALLRSGLKSAAGLLPGAVPGAIRQAGPTAVAAATFQGAAGPMRAAMLCTAWQGAGTWMAVVAPQAAFEQARPQLVRILQSFRFTEAKAPAGAGPALAYTRFTEPREQAWSAEVPRDWRTQGGLMRVASVDVRSSLETVSPDGAVRVFAGDANLPPHTVPNQTLALTGFREGSWYSPGYGVRMLVRRYTPGVQFAEWYAVSTLARGNPGLRIHERKDRSDLTAAVNRLYQQAGQFGFGQRLDMGDVSFDVAGAGQPLSGYLMAGTLLTSNPSLNLGLWQVEALYGYTAPAPRLAEARAVLERLLETFQLNPQWVQMQQNITAATSRIVSQTAREISRIQNDTYWARQASQDRINQNFSDHIRGVVRLRDEVTGELFEAPSGSNYYLRVRGANVAIGTDTGDRPPNIDVNVLLEVR